MTFPTETTVGPTIPNPPNVGMVELFNGQTASYTDAVLSGVKLWGSAQLDLTRCRVEGSVVLLPTEGAGSIGFAADLCSVLAGMSINPVDAQGNLYWGPLATGNVLITNSYIFHPQAASTGDPGTNPHTEALAGFGRLPGVQFIDVAMHQQGPMATPLGTATAVINWYGPDAVFRRVLFGWAGTSAAAFYTVYSRASNVLFEDCHFEMGLGDYVYNGSGDNDGEPVGIFVNCVDAQTLQLIPQSTGEPPPPDPEPEMDTLSIISASVQGGASVGTVTIIGTENVDQRLNFVPHPDFVGDAVIDYTVEDDAGQQSSSTATVTVELPPNPPPQAVADTATTFQGVAVDIDVLANDLADMA